MKIIKYEQFSINEDLDEDTIKKATAASGRLLKRLKKGNPGDPVLSEEDREALLKVLKYYGKKKLD